MKMANMDAVFDFMFTNPVDEHGVSRGLNNFYGTFYGLGKVVS